MANEAVFQPTSESLKNSLNATQYLRKSLVPQVVKKFLKLYGTPNLITAFTKVGH
jgi:hypothetical protein